MSTLTKQDLQEWHSHPVTLQIFKRIKEETLEIKSESCLRDTCDQTAMQVARNEGMAEGVQALAEIYDDMLEASE